MKFINFVTYLFYRYYSKGATKDVAYIKTVGSTVLLILINFWIVLILLNPTDLIPDTTNVSKGIKYLKMALYTSPLILFFFIFIKERDLKAMSYDEHKVKRASMYLWTYVIFSFVVMIALMFIFSSGSNH